MHRLTCGISFFPHSVNLILFSPSCTYDLITVPVLALTI